MLADQVADRARSIACEVAARLRDPHLVARAIETTSLHRGLAASDDWDPIGLALGHAGLAVTFRQLDACFSGQGWDDVASRHLELALAELRRERRAVPGLFSGLAGVGFAASFLGERRSERLLATLDGLIRRHVEAAITRIEARGHGCAESELDVVSGLAGVGAYFLTRRDELSLLPIVDSLARLLLAGGSVPAWHAPPELLDSDARSAYPHGRLNCGLAHGLPGPLALLGLARSAGIGAASVEAALERGTAWIVEHSFQDQWGVNWPDAVPLPPDAEARPRSRAAWCYGAPGISRALWLSGSALGKPELQALAVDALETVLRRPPEVRMVDAPTFCHGLAGLLHITLRLAHDSGSAELTAGAADLAVAVIDAYEPDSILGYRDLSPDGRRLDRAGVLTGAAGTALVLLAAATFVEPQWDRLFLLG